MISEVDPEETSTNVVISSLTSYADSDEEIGNTPPNNGDKKFDSFEKQNEIAVAPVEERSPAKLEDSAIEPMPDKSAPNSEIGEDAYADTEFVEGSNAGGDYNMLPSEFDSDEDKQFSGESF